MKKYSLFISLLILISAAACNKERITYNRNVSACGTVNPIANLSWLNEKYKLLTGGADLNGIVLYKYQDKEVIEIQSAVSSSTNNHQYYCDGTKLDLNDPQNFAKFKKERIEISVLYGTKIWAGFP